MISLYGLNKRFWTYLHLTTLNWILNKYYESSNFICSGRKNPRTGGVIICNAKNIEDVNEIISEDPFNRNGIAKYDILEFHPTKYAEDFKAFVE